jgi:hypothetical protein
VTVSWLPPTNLGYKPPLLEYEVQVATNIVYEDFSVGRFPDPSQWSTMPTYSSLATKTPAVVPNAFDFTRSAVTGLPMLRAGADINGNCGMGWWGSGPPTINGVANTMDLATCAMWLRNFPPGIDVTGSWQIETHLFMGSPLQPAAINSIGVIGIYDSTQNGGAGLLSHYGGIRSDGYPYNPGEWEGGKRRAPIYALLSAPAITLPPAPTPALQPNQRFSPPRNLSPPFSLSPPPCLLRLGER